MKRSEQPKIETGRWLTTYCDLMNNLLVFFILLYMLSVIDMQKYLSIVQSFKTTLKGEKPAVVQESGIDINSIGESSQDTEQKSEGVLDDLDKFVSDIKEMIAEKGYEDDIVVERVDQYVYFRFKEGVLFYPDQAVLKKGSYDVLSYIGDVLKEAYPEISSMEIAGHTQWVPSDENTENFTSWKLSSDRSVTVLQFLLSDCKLPYKKMVIMGYSCTQPYTKGETAAERELNRRVEIRISRIVDEK